MRSGRMLIELKTWMSSHSLDHNSLGEDSTLAPSWVIPEISSPKFHGDAYETAYLIRHHRNLL